MYFMSDPQALHVTRNVIPGKLGVDLHLHRVHIPLVSEIFNVEKYRDLEIPVKGQSRSGKVVPFDRLGTVSY